jgi:hypothetical protein
MQSPSHALSPRQLIALTLVIALLVTTVTLIVTSRLARAIEPGVPVVFVATGANFPDALAGGALAAVSGGPLLFVTRDSIPAATVTELQRLEPERIVILGGTSVVSAAVENQLGDYTAGPVARLAGADRFGTAVEISKATPDAPAVSEPTPTPTPDPDPPSAPAGHDHGIRRTNVGSLGLTTAYSSRSLFNLDLDDPCGDGATRWNLFVTAHTSATALNTTVDVDLTITLDSTEENVDARTRSTIDGTTNTYRNLSLQALFTEVEPGDHTVRLLARKGDVPNAVSLNRGRMILTTMGYACA